MSATRTVLRHAHLPGITKFARAQELQQSLVQQFLAHKALVSSTSRSPSEPPLPPPPPPTVLTFTPTPVYTLGRREHGSLSEQQEALLLQPLTSKSGEPGGRSYTRYAEIVETQRGGQTTFHGPGQLVIYPIIDLKPTIPFHCHEKGLTVRSYVELLEQATIDTLREWDIKGTRTEDPGVWEEMDSERPGIPKKIAALGVHLRRNVTSYGVGLNIKTDLKWFDRIVACGLVGKGVTTMEIIGKERGLWTRNSRLEREKAIEQEMIALAATGKEAECRQKHSQLRLAHLKATTVGRAWVRAFARGLCGAEGDYSIRKVTGNDLGAEIEEYRGEEDIRG